jgi:hypothetical protein
VVFFFGCEKDPIEIVPYQEPDSEQLYDFVCKEYHSFLFFDTAFQSLSSIGIAKVDTVYGVSNSYILEQMELVYVDTIIRVVNKYILDPLTGRLERTYITDGDTIGRKLHFLQCTKL